MKKYRIFLMSVLITLLCALFIGLAACTGATGDTGEKGDTGATGSQGIQGETGDDGDDGKTAYQLYVEAYGYTGTEAQWIEDLINGNLFTTSYTVTFDTNGGTEVESQKVASGHKATKPEVTKEGYTFKGWYCEEELWSFIGYAVTEDITLTAEWEITTTGVTYTLNAEETEYSVTGYSGTDTEVYLCAEYNGLPVTSIGASVFASNKNITLVSIPATITTIGDYAFNDTDNLATIYYSGTAAQYASIAVPRGSSAPTYKGAVLYLNGVLAEDLVIDGISAIGKCTFYGCSSIKSVTIGADVESIGDYAFNACTSLESIYIPVSLTSFGSSAFYSSTNLTKVYYAGTATQWASITYGSGSACPTYNGAALYLEGNTETAATQIVIEGITEISGCAFYGCTSITSIVLDSTVTTINNHAFNSCANLAAVYYKGDSTAYANISIGTNNTYLTGATVYYYSETQPAEGDTGNYWHYVNGEIIVYSEQASA